MGKRKHHDEEEYLERKIRKLERKRSKIRRKHRRRRSDSYVSSSSSERIRYYDEAVESDQNLMDYNDPDSSQETTTHKGAPHDDDGSLVDLVAARPTMSSRPGHAPAASQASPTTLTSVAGPSTSSALLPAQADVDATAPSELTSTTELDPDVLCILGDEPSKEAKFGPSIQKDISIRWSDILVNGLKDETKKEIQKRYEVPENFKLAQAPVLNPEIKAAVNENVLKRDNILLDKQNLLTTALTSVATTISTYVTMNTKDDDNKSQILKSLSDTGRLLCHIHFSETQSRRNFLLASLNKEVKENIKDLKRDHLLFGNDLQESLKSMKAITKTGAELRPTTTKSKLQPKSKQSEASTSKALNWRGPPPPPPQPRRNQARPTSTPTAGGRRQQPARRAPDRRAPRHHGRTSRR